MSDKISSLQEKVTKCLTSTQELIGEQAGLAARGSPLNVNTMMAQSLANQAILMTCVAHLLLREQAEDVAAELKQVFTKTDPTIGVTHTKQDVLRRMGVATELKDLTGSLGEAVNKALGDDPDNENDPDCTKMV